jgi:hypothetical protein
VEWGRIQLLSVQGSINLLGKWKCRKAAHVSRKRKYWKNLRDVYCSDYFKQVLVCYTMKIGEDSAIGESVVVRMLEKCQGSCHI